MVEQLLKLAQLETANRIQYKLRFKQYQVNQTLKYVISSFEAVILDKHQPRIVKPRRKAKSDH
jgi:hypothetical protein